eukprot:CAMPEP_0168370708 /NCGR_PEP_ID=MMETSP0228-20121227/7400_1 /TAXON_ID=133427 /ORGANISM="Protoceratium reticulatum, Strain CCCM 535 (=CCMP 1889)" /LENGTH=286 /DNA_ID=CAMNT_0008383583 /DNA_START=184 /DNA_END=1041 /DNA_ORIENTATION=-
MTGRVTTAMSRSLGTQLPGRASLAQCLVPVLVAVLDEGHGGRRPTAEAEDQHCGGGGGGRREQSGARPEEDSSLPDEGVDLVHLVLPRRDRRRLPGAHLARVQGVQHVNDPLGGLRVLLRLVPAALVQGLVHAESQLRLGLSGLVEGVMIEPCVSARREGPRPWVRRANSACHLSHVAEMVVGAQGVLPSRLRALLQTSGGNRDRHTAPSSNLLWPVTDMSVRKVWHLVRMSEASSASCGEAAASSASATAAQKRRLEVAIGRGLHRADLAEDVLLELGPSWAKMA